MRRPFNWRLFGLLCTLNVIGAFATLPISVNLMPSTPTVEGVDMTREALIVGIIIVQAVFALLLVALTAVGMLLANRANLGAPILAGWLAREPVGRKLKGALQTTVIAGFVLPIVELIIIGLTRWLEGYPPDIGFRYPPDTIAPLWQGFLGAVGAGITEETIFRLFAFSLIVWLGWLIRRKQANGPSRAWLWAATFLSAFLFGLYHLTTARLDNPWSVMRSVGLNSLGGMVFGWLYWRHGLASSMLGHTLADIVLYVIAPFFIAL
jgi:membrane protease YdiL (CAAX protease family)